MNLEALLQTYQRMLSPPPAPPGKPYTILGTPPPLIQSVAKASIEPGSPGVVQSLSLEEKWISATYYCQGVIRANVVEGRIHFREMDAGMDELKSLVVGYNLPPLLGLSPNVAFRFADVGVEEWSQIFNASQSSRDELLARVSINFEGTMPVPPSLLKVISGHLVNPRKVKTSERDRKRVGDRDTLFVWLADRVSEVCGVSPSGALDSILKVPLELKGVTAAAAAFAGLGLEMNPRRSARIFEENKEVLKERPKFQYLLVPDFLATPNYAANSMSTSDDDVSTTHRKQMETALRYVISPNLGEA